MSTLATRFPNDLAYTVFFDTTVFAAATCHLIRRSMRHMAPDAFTGQQFKKVCSDGRPSAGLIRRPQNISMALEDENLCEAIA
jgi:hypothetical protein